MEVTVGKSFSLVFGAEFHRQPVEFIQQCVTWCRFVSSEGAERHCSEPNAVELFVPRANRLRQSCSNQVGR